MTEEVHIEHPSCWGCINLQGETIIPFEYDELKTLEEGIIRAKKGGYWGCVNLQWETVIPFEYDELESFVDVITPAKKDGRWGYINLQGETIITFEYDELKTPEDDIIRAKKGGLWGYINLQGETIIPFEYDELKAFEDGVAQARKGYYWGKIDVQGNPIIEAVEEVSAGVFKATQLGMVGLQDSEGRVIYPFILDELKPFENGIALARNGNYSGRCGCINLQGETIIPFEYDALYTHEDDIIRAKKEGCWGSFNLQGETIIPFEYDELETPEDGIIRAKKGGYWGCVNFQGETIIPFEYDELKTPEGDIIRAKKGGRWGCVNLQGETIIPFKYDELKAFEDGVAQAKKEDCWGKIDAQGNPISEDVEEGAAGVFKAKQFGKVGLQDSEGRLIYPFVLDELKAFENGIALARKGYSWSGRWGCINLHGETLIPIEYDVLTTPENNIMRAEKNGRWGGFNLQGETIIPFEYSELKPFEDGVAQAKKGDRWGKIDAQGNPISEDVEEVSAGVFKAKQFGKLGLQDEKGKVICPFAYDEVILSRGGYIAYQGEFRSPNNRRPKGRFTYKALPVVEAQVLEATVVHKVDYGIFISIKGMASSLIHNSVLSKTEFGSKISVGDNLRVIATGINKKHHVIAVELVGLSPQEQ